MKPKAQSRFDRLYDEHLRTLKRHGKADKTIEAYGRAVRRLADFVDDCPDALSVDELNAYFEWLIDNRGWSTVKLDRNGIRFFYEEVLGKTMPWPDMVRPPKVQALPDVLSIDEIARLVAATRERRYRIFWLATYSMGLRLGDPPGAASRRHRQPAHARPRPACQGQEGSLRHPAHLDVAGPALLVAGTSASAMAVSGLASLR